MCKELISKKAMLQAITDIDGGVNMDIYTNEVREIVAKLPTIPQVVCDDDCEHCSWVECPLPQKAEQTDVLDKIRTEIERHRRKTESIDPYDLVGDCLDIIDKYKAESEEEE